LLVGYTNSTFLFTHVGSNSLLNGSGVDGRGA